MAPLAGEIPLSVSLMAMTDPCPVLPRPSWPVRGPELTIWLRRAVSCLAVLLAICSCRKAGAGPVRLTRTFPAADTAQVTVSAWQAASAAVVVEPRGDIEISGVPRLAANGYHDPDPAGRVPSVDQWTFDFPARREGRSLVISSQGETLFPRYRYFLDALEIHVPPGIEVVRKKQSPVPGLPASVKQHE